jgi:hypothetical protein
VRGWEANLADYSRGQKMRFTAFGFDRAEEAKAAFPSVRQAGDQFADIVRWTQFAMIEGEEYGIT